MLKIPDALLDPKSYPEKVKKVKMLQTHTSWVFLTGKYAYKIKKPVDFGFLDYTTPEKRKKFCYEEIRLNRRLCPSLYLEVVPVVRKGNNLHIDGKGEVVDYAVKMRELPQRAIMTQLIKRGKIGFEVMDRIAKIMADFHEKAEANEEISSYGSIATVRYNWEENFLQTEGFVDSLIKTEIYEEIKGSVERFMEEKPEIFEERIEQGKVRWLHGDFHSGNIFIQNGIWIFDCIEFNRRFSCSDTASEIAFFVMDLDFLDSKGLGDYFVYKYIGYSGDTELLRLLDFYKCYRAYVRGKVMGFKVFDERVKETEKNQSKVIARKYFRLSHLYARRLFDSPTLVLIYGLPGVGKSFVSEKLARQLNVFHLRTDILRKEIASVSPDEHRHPGFGKGIYSKDMTDETYRKILEVARILLSHGKSCILDGSFSKREWRTRALELAEGLKISFYSIYCKCPQEIVFERISTRTRDPSDAIQETYLKMKDHFDPPEPESIVIDTSQRITRLIHSLLSKLSLTD